jgi:hypothetical protein
MGWRLLSWWWGDSSSVVPASRVALLRPRLRIAVLRPMETPLSNIITGYAKGAAARLIFGFDWSEENAETHPDDVMTGSAWTVTGATKLSEPTTVDETTLVELSGGVPGTFAYAVNVVTYASGQIDTRTLEIRIL